SAAARPAGGVRRAAAAAAPCAAAAEGTVAGGCAVDPARALHRRASCRHRDVAAGDGAADRTRRVVRAAAARVPARPARVSAAVISAASDDAARVAAAVVAPSVPRSIEAAIPTEPVRARPPKPGYGPPPYPDG